MGVGTGVDDRASGSGERAARLLLIVVSAAAAVVLVALSRVPVASGAVVLLVGGLALTFRRRGRAAIDSAVSDAAARLEALAEVYGAAERRHAGADTDAETARAAAARDERALDARLDAARELISLRSSRSQSTIAALRAVVDAVDAPVFACDEGGRVWLCNRAAERLFRRRSGRLAGQMLEELFTSTKLLALHGSAREGHAANEDIPMMFDGVQRVFEVSAVPSRPDIADLPARAAPRAGVVITLRDVTEVAEMVRLKTDFVANASHELRTPIASIRAAVETLFGCEDDGMMRRRLAEMIQNNVLRLEEMVADLLDLSHVEGERAEAELLAIPFSEVEASMRGLFEETLARRSITLEFDVDARLERFRTDRKLIHLILRNLIENAIKFSTSGARVRVEARATPAETRVAGADRAGGARLRVIDEGEGIPLKHQSRIFERFYQADASRARHGERRGTGLGLAIVKHAVRRLGGEISVESIWQEGTTMTVELPRCVPLADADVLDAS